MKNVYDGKVRKEENERKEKWSPPVVARRRQLTSGPTDGLFVRDNGAKARDFIFVLWAGTRTTVGGNARGASGGVAGWGVVGCKVVGSPIFFHIFLSILPFFFPEFSLFTPTRLAPISWAFFLFFPNFSLFSVSSQDTLQLP